MVITELMPEVPSIYDICHLRIQKQQKIITIKIKSLITS